MTVLMFNRTMLAELKTALALARTRGEDSFMFYGTELLVSYAEYVVEYLDTQFGPDNVSVPETVH